MQYILVIALIIWCFSNDVNTDGKKYDAFMIGKVPLVKVYKDCEDRK